MSEQPLGPATTNEAPKGETPIAYRAVRGGLWVLASSYWAIGFGFAANILLTRLLTPEIYGEFALAMFFILLFQLRQKLGLSYAFAHHGRVDGEAVGTLFILEVGLGVASLLVTLAAAPVLIYMGYSTVTATIVVVISVVALLESISTTFAAILEKKLHFKPLSVIGSLALPASYAPAFWFAIWGPKELALVAQHVAYSLFFFAGIAYYVFRRMRDTLQMRWRFDRRLGWQFARFGIGIGGIIFLAGVATQLDNFILGTIGGAAALGYYDRAYRTAQWPSLLLNALISRSAYFTYTNLKTDRERLEKTASMVFWICGIVAMPIAAVLFITAPDLIPAIYGARWAPAVPFLQILVIAAVLRPLWENVSAILMGMGATIKLTAIVALQVFVLLIVGWPLTAYWEGAGIAIAVVLAQLVVLAAGLRIVGSYARLRFSSDLGWPIFVFASVIVLHLGLEPFLPLDNLVAPARILLKSAYAFVAYWLLLFVVQPSQTRQRLQYIIRLAKGR